MNHLTFVNIRIHDYINIRTVTLSTQLKYSFVLGMGNISTQYQITEQEIKEQVKDLVESFPLKGYKIVKSV